MVLNPERDDLCLGIIGAGTMGRGIAQIAATAGITVLLYDSNPRSSAAAFEFIRAMLERAVAKGRMSTNDVASALARIHCINELAGMKSCHIVIEAILEDIAAKHALFSTLEPIVSPETILATNTSSLSVTAIAAACKHPERVAGMHFFNPVPLMKLVEIIEGIRTSPDISATLAALGRRLGREPVQLQDTPGFLVNQVGRGFTVEATHIVAEGVADFATIDRIMRDAGGFRMGPFELMDLTGLDVTYPASQSIFEQHFYEPRYRPTGLMRLRKLAGQLGRKTGSGFYQYQHDQPVTPAEPPCPYYDNRPVWISRDEPAGHALLTKLAHQHGVIIDDAEQPGPESLLLVTPIGTDATTSALAQNLDPRRTLAVDTLYGFDRRRTLMRTPATEPAFCASAQGFLHLDGIPVSLIEDSPGFVAQRIIALIVNIGCAIAEQRVAAPDAIDKAVTLGLGYPFGPLCFGDTIGAERILQVLTSMQHLYGDPRYRPTLWLRRRAQLGLSLLQR